MAAAGDLTTITDVKNWLGVTTSNGDENLSRLITAASTFIQSWLNRTIAVQAYSQTLNGTNSKSMMLANAPIVSISSLTINGSVIAPAADSQSSGYLYDDNTVYLSGYTFWRGLQNIKISYSAGYSVIPYDIAQACIELVAMRFKEKERIGLASQAIGGETTAYSIKDMPSSVQTTLNQYRRVVPI